MNRKKLIIALIEECCTLIQQNEWAYPNRRPHGQWREQSRSFDGKNSTQICVMYVQNTILPSNRSSTSRCALILLVYQLSNFNTVE